ncbi:MAG: serine/threonine-protein kinase [Nannocystaceae bacterium]
MSTEAGGVDGSGAANSRRYAQDERAAGVDAEAGLLRPIPAVDDLEGARIKARSRALLFGDPQEVLRIGRLEVIARIGAGGMGEVYAARDVELRRKVAVKLVRSDVDDGGDEATARIIREARLMARLTHPNVVRIYDVGRIGARVYITMEFVEGSTLNAWLERRPRPWREVLGRFLLAGRGLAAAHRTGLVHRDFKPSNVLVGDDGRVLVADFGLARPLVGEAEIEATETAMSTALTTSSTASMRLVTAHGAILGTPGYMSPEQLQAASVDARSDLFSFSVALYEALYGVRPFAGASALELLHHIEAGAFTPPLKGREVPRRIGRAIERGLAADPDRRFATMDELLGALEAALGRRWRLGAGALGLTVAGALLVPRLAADPCADAGAELAQVWSDERRATVKAAFAATGLPFAADAWTRLDEQLDAYAAAWTRARVDACEAVEVRRSHSPRLFDRRMLCLERRERAFRSLVDTFAVADARSVAEAISAASSLPAIEPCNDGELLDRGVEPPATRAAEIAVAQARETIARADAQWATGHYSEGLVLADASLALLGRVDYEPARAEALVLRGRLLARLGPLDDAEAALLDAAEIAEASRHDEIAADAWIELVRLANRQLDDVSRGEAWIRRARAAMRRLDDGPRRQIDVLLEEGLLEARTGDYAASERAFAEALRLLDEGGDDSLVRGKIEHDLAVTLEADGRDDEAAAAYERARALLEGALGPGHPELARFLHDHGTFLMVHGDLPGASERLGRALTIAAEAFDAAHPVAGRIHISLVEVALRSGDPRGAIAHAEAAVRSFEGGLPEGHPDHVDAAVALGGARFFAGDLEGALAAFVRSRELLPVPADPLTAAITAGNVAETLVALGRWREAAAALDEVDLLLARLPERDLDLEARLLGGRGELALASGQRDRAIDLLEAAIATREALPEDPQASARLEAALARAAVDDGGARTPRTSPQTGESPADAQRRRSH